MSDATPAPVTEEIRTRIVGYADACVALGLHAVRIVDPASDEPRTLNLFYTDQLIRDLVMTRAEDWARFLSGSALSPTISSDAIISQQRFEEYAKLIGADELQKIINEHLSRQWPRYAQEIVSKFKWKTLTEHTGSPSQRASDRISIGILWCTYFDRSGREKRWWRLPDAYRAPSLFARSMQRAGHHVQLLVCDEDLKLTDLNGTTASLHDDVQLLYVASHGTFGKGRYEVLLSDNNWRVAGLGHKQLSAVVFDTCWMLDKSQNWMSAWAGANLGPKVRLLLGFEGQAMIDRALALRGRAFAENLKQGDPFAEAWIKAVRSTAIKLYARKNTQAVAVAIGDDIADSVSILDTMRLTTLAAHMPRKNAAPVLVERY